MEDFERWFRYPFSNDPQSNENHISMLSKQVQEYQSEVRDLQDQLRVLAREVTRLQEQISQIERNQTQHSTLAVPRGKHIRTNLTSPILGSPLQQTHISSRKKGGM